MTPSDWISFGTVGIAVAGQAITYGMLRQKVKDLEQQIATLSGSLATRESVRTAEGRISDLEAEMKDVPKLITAVEVLKTEVKGFRELYGRDIDEVKHGIRNMRQAFEGFVQAGRPSSSRPARTVNP